MWALHIGLVVFKLRSQGRLRNHKSKFLMLCLFCWTITYWGRVLHICGRRIIIIGSDNGLSPGRRQTIVIIWTNVGILSVRTLGTHFSQILSKVYKFLPLKMSSVKWRAFYLGLNVLSDHIADGNTQPSYTSDVDNYLTRIHNKVGKID